MRLKFGILSLILLSLMISSCTKDKLDDPNSGGNNVVDGELWTGSMISFTKANNADPSAEANQDRITDKVWLTRGNNGGQIYNVKSESTANKSSSPAGTRWAVGTMDQVNSLEFKAFREGVGMPKNIAGKNLVLHLVEDNIYISVKFTNWSEQKGGGFSYERSTQP